MISMKERSGSVIISLSVILLLFTSGTDVMAQMKSQHFGMPASTIDSGGGRQGSSVFGMQNSIGQPMPPGSAKSAHFALFCGLHACAADEFSILTGQRGDVDNNGSINVVDILAVANHILGIVILTGDAYQRADCDGNGTINILDALGIANVILGIYPEWPGGARGVEESNGRSVEE